MVQQLVMSLGGHVNVRSEIGIGTQADIYIPVQYLPASFDPADRRPRQLSSQEPPQCMHAW
jgi:hypothetical protein